MWPSQSASEPRSDKNEEESIGPSSQLFREQRIYLSPKNKDSIQAIDRFAPD